MFSGDYENKIGKLFGGDMLKAVKWRSSSILYK